MVRWLRWHCPPDTGFEIRALAVWGRARYLSVTEAPHNTNFHTWMGKKQFCFFQTAETGNRTPDSGVKGSGANHYPRAPARAPSKHEPSYQCRITVGPPSTTLAQHWFYIGTTCLMARVCCVSGRGSEWLHVYVWGLVYIDKGQGHVGPYAWCTGVCIGGLVIIQLSIQTCIQTGYFTRYLQVGYCRKYFSLRVTVRPFAKIKTKYSLIFILHYSLWIIL